MPGDIWLYPSFFLCSCSNATLQPKDWIYDPSCIEATPPTLDYVLLTLYRNKTCLSSRAHILSHANGRWCLVCIPQMPHDRFLSCVCWQWAVLRMVVGYSVRAYRHDEHVRSLIAQTNPMLCKCNDISCATSKTLVSVGHPWNTCINRQPDTDFKAIYPSWRMLINCTDRVWTQIPTLRNDGNDTRVGY